MKHCTVLLMSLNAVGVKIIFSEALEIGTFLMEMSLGIEWPILYLEPEDLNQSYFIVTMYLHQLEYTDVEYMMRILMLESTLIMKVILYYRDNYTHI